MSTRKQMNNATKSAKKYSSYFGGDSDGDNGNMSGGDERDPEVDYDDYESEAEDDSVANDKKSKPADGLDSGNEEPNEDSEDDEDEEEDQGEEEDEDEDLDAPIDTEDEDEDEDDESDESDEEQGEEEDADGNVVSRPYARKPVPARNRKPVQNQVNVYSKSDDSEGEDDEDEDENYLQKFNAEINKEYIVEHHPECVISNYDEIATLATVVRDKNGNIVDDLHRTPPYLTKYERARILGQRAKQVNTGAPIYVKVPEKVIDGYLIAEMELKNKLIPFIIRRPLPNGGSEYWRLSSLEDVAF